MHHQLAINCTDLVCDIHSNLTYIFDLNLDIDPTSSSSLSAKSGQSLQAVQGAEGSSGGSRSGSRMSTQGCRLYDFVIEALLMGTLCLFGFAGNTLSMVCLRRDRSRSATPLLLISLEITDTLFLSAVFVVRAVASFQRYTQAMPWLNKILPYAGKYLFPAAITAETGTIYLTVLVTVNRYLAVCRPYDPPSRRSVESARLHVLAVILFCVVYNIPRFFEYEVVEIIRPMKSRFSNSTSKNETLSGEGLQRVLVAEKTQLLQNRFYKIFYCNLLYFLVMFLIPLVVLMALNGGLIRVLREKKAKRAQLLRGRTRQQVPPVTGVTCCDERSTINVNNLAAGSSTKSQHLAPQCPPQDAVGRSEDDITLMLIVVVLVFVVCQTPALATQLLLVVLVEVDPAAMHCPRPFFYYERISDLLVVANSSVNFIIYCFCSRTFRQTVLSVVCRRPQQNQHLQQQQQRQQNSVAATRRLPRTARNESISITAAVPAPPPPTPAVEQQQEARVTSSRKAVAVAHYITMELNDLTHQVDASKAPVVMV